ncbi:MAG: hypothetical protein CSA97_01285 [Bacteroidetes bacterium]|nr:MAG: hypothetical protein CSA97_01285 [Bacteroidota bacterium]
MYLLYILLLLMCFAYLRRRLNGGEAAFYHSPLVLAGLFLFVGVYAVFSDDYFIYQEIVTKLIPTGNYTRFTPFWNAYAEAIGNTNTLFRLLTLGGGLLLLSWQGHLLRLRYLELLPWFIALAGMHLITWLRFELACMLFVLGMTLCLRRKAIGLVVVLLPFVLHPASFLFLLGVGIYLLNPQRLSMRVLMWLGVLLVLSCLPLLVDLAIEVFGISSFWYYVKYFRWGDAFYRRHFLYALWGYMIYVLGLIVVYLFSRVGRCSPSPLAQKLTRLMEAFGLLSLLFNFIPVTPHISVRLAGIAFYIACVVGAMSMRQLRVFAHRKLLLWMVVCLLVMSGMETVANHHDDLRVLYDIMYALAS